jgi:hypothetical protein
VPGLWPFLLPLFTELPRTLILGNPCPYTRVLMRYRGVRERACSPGLFTGLPSGAVLRSRVYSTIFFTSYYYRAGVLRGASHSLGPYNNSPACIERASSCLGLLASW